MGKRALAYSNAPTSRIARVQGQKFLVPALRATSLMTNAVFHSAFGMFSAAMFWGGMAVAAVILAILLITENSSGVRPPGCQRGLPARPEN